MNKKTIVILIIILSIFLVGGIVTGVVVSSKSSSKSSGSNQTKSCINNCYGNGTCDSNGVCTCYPGYSGPDCKVECPSLCSNRGTCKDGICTCKAGYSGLGCELINCPTGNGKTCSGNGICDTKTGTCKCTNGSLNVNCSTNCPKGSNGQICSGNGTCNNTNGICQCKTGYSGTDCSIPCPGAPTNVCSGNGTCFYDGQNTKCLCKTGYKGTDCSELSCPGDPNNTCSGNGSCNTTTGRCNCNTNYFGDDCSISCPGVPNNVCSGNGTCTYTNGTVICNCNSRYYGTNCSSFCSNDFIFDYTNRNCTTQRYLTGINQFGSSLQIYSGVNYWYNNMLGMPQQGAIANVDQKLFIKKIDYNYKTQTGSTATEKRYVITNNSNVMFELVQPTGTSSDTYYFKVTTDSTKQATFKIFKLYNTFNLVNGGASKAGIAGDALNDGGGVVGLGKDSNLIRYVDNSLNIAGQPANNNYSDLYYNISKRLNIRLDCIQDCSTDCYCPTLPTSGTIPLKCKVVLPGTNSIQRCINNYNVYSMMLIFNGLSTNSAIPAEVVYYLKDGSIVVCVKYVNSDTNTTKYFFRKKAVSVQVYSSSTIPTFTDFSNYSNFINSASGLTLAYNTIGSINSPSTFKLAGSAISNNVTDYLARGVKADEVYFLANGDIIVCILDKDSTQNSYKISRLGDNSSYYCISSKAITFTDFSDYDNFRTSASGNVTWFSSNTPYEVCMYGGKTITIN